MNVRKLATLACFLICARVVDAQTVSLSELSLESRGSIADGDSRAIFETAARLGIWFIPTDWVRIRARTAMYIPDTEAFLWRLDGDTDPGWIFFDGAEIAFPSIRGSDVSVTLFTGYLDNPASGTFLRESLKTRIDEPEFYGMPAGMAFAPDTEIRGTGCAVSAVPGSSGIAVAGYAFWNERSGTDGAFTVDARIVGDGRTASVNAFSGAYVKPGTADIAFRAGATALFRSEGGHELYAGAGFKGVEANLSDLERNLYFLFEPRLHLGMTDFVLSFFSSPTYPLVTEDENLAEADKTYLGLNVLVAYGRLRENGFRTGVSLLGCINPEEPSTVSPFSFSVSPFVSFLVSDYELALTAVLNPLYLDDPSTAGELRFLLKAVF